MKYNLLCDMVVGDIAPVKKQPDSDDDGNDMEIELVPSNDTFVIQSYVKEKESFEKMLFKLNQTGGDYCVLKTATNDFAVWPEVKVQKEYRWMKFTHIDPETNQPICKRFVPRWLDDGTKICYESVIRRPFAPRGPYREFGKDYVNVWPGFLAEEFEGPDLSDERIAELVAPIVDHFKMMFDGEHANVEFVMRWLAHIIQRPYVKTGVGVLLQGEEGVGKDIILHWFGEKLLGPLLFTQTADINDMFGPHAIGLKNKTFVVIDEVCSKQTLPLFEALKNALTAPFRNFNPKYEQPYRLECQVNFMFTTNNKCAIAMGPNDRHWAAFLCKDTKKGDRDYFDNLMRTLNHPDTPRAFFKHLKENVDLSTISRLEDVRPLSTYYKELRMASLNWPTRFLSLLCHHSEDPDAVREYESILGMDFLEKYREWLKHVHPDLSTKITDKSFSSSLDDVVFKCPPKTTPTTEQLHSNGIARYRKGGRAHYRIHFPSLKDHLERRNMFDYRMDS